MSETTTSGVAVVERIESSEELADRIKLMNTDQLLAELVDAMGMTARRLLRLAMIWAELEGRGVDLSHLRTGLYTYLSQIASGAVLPETVVQFAGHHIYQKVAALPAAEQRRLAAGESVRLVVRRSDGYTHRLVQPRLLSAAQAWQVFGDRYLRSDDEQIHLLNSQPTQPALPPVKSAKRGAVRADREKGVLLVGRTQIRPADAVAALSDLAGGDGDGPGPDAPSVSARLTPEEHDTLRQKAAAGHTTISTLVRRALKANGLI